MALITPENKTQIIVIVVAVAAGIVAAALVGGYVSSKVNEETGRIAGRFEKTEQQKDQQYQQQMAALNEKLMAVEQNSKRAVEEAARVAATPKAAPVVVEGPKKKPSLALRTPAGKRAVTVMIDSLGAVGGLLNPGDFVDVIAHLTVPTSKKGAAKEPVTAMIFQGLQVLAIDTNLEVTGEYDIQQKQSALKVTFAVEPREAGLLSFAEKNGKIELALRPPSEKGHEMLAAATWTTLAEYVLENDGADIQVPEPAKDIEETGKSNKPAEEAQPYIEIYRGGREL